MITPVSPATARGLGWDQPVGKTLGGGIVIGVVEDFHFATLHDPLESVVLIPELDNAEETRLSNTLRTFSLVAIMVSCLGLVGLASYAAQQRTREIGVRKALGATTNSLVQLLSKEFMLIALIANVVAWPIAYLSMDRWLQSFAYRISIGPGSFLIAGILCVSFVIIAVGYHCVILCPWVTQLRAFWSDLSTGPTRSSRFPRRLQSHRHCP